MRISWSEDAISDLQEIWHFIADDSPQSATGSVSRVRVAARGLERFPRQGRVGTKAGTRELVEPRTPYIIIYRIELNVVLVLAVLHGAQRRPE